MRLPSHATGRTTGEDGRMVTSVNGGAACFDQKGDLITKLHWNHGTMVPPQIKAEIFPGPWVDPFVSQTVWAH